MKTRLQSPHSVSKSKIIKLFVRYNNVKKVSEKTGITQYRIREILIKKFGLSITEFKKILRLSPYNDIRLSSDDIALMKKAKEVYDKSGTLKKTAKEIGLSPERVRQILKEAARYKVVEHLTSRKKIHKKITELKKLFPRERIISELIASTNIFLVSLRLGLSEKDLARLIRHYKIRKEDYRFEHKRQKWIKRYRQIVLTLGHYPTVTELKSYGKWASVYNATCRYWGSFENFRKEMNIPGYREKVSNGDLKKK